MAPRSTYWPAARIALLLPVLASNGFVYTRRTAWVGHRAMAQSGLFWQSWQSWQSPMGQTLLLSAHGEGGDGAESEEEEDLEEVMRTAGWKDLPPDARWSDSWSPADGQWNVDLADGPRGSPNRWSLRQKKEGLDATEDEDDAPVETVNMKELNQLVKNEFRSSLDIKIPGANAPAVPATAATFGRMEFVDGPENMIRGPGRALPINLDLLNYHARVARMRRNYTEAIRLWEIAMRMDPLDGRAWLALARHKTQVNRKPEEARKVFQEALGHCEGNPYLLQAFGVLEEREGNVPRAAELYKEATRWDPTHVASWVARGRLAHRLQRIDEARACFRRATSEDPNSYYAWQCWGVLESRLGDVDAARKLFQRSIDANPRNAASYQTWGVMESNLGNYENATELFRKGQRRSRRNRFVLQAWAVSEAKQGHHKEAVDLFERAIASWPNDAGVYQAYAIMCKDLGDFAGARRLFSQGVKADKKHIPVYQAWGTMEAQCGDMEAARSVFQQGVWAAPRGHRVSQLWTTWAMLEANYGHLAPAREYFKYALEASQPVVPTRVVVNWALVEEQFSNVERARTLFESAVRADDTNQKLWFAYEAFEQRQGNFEDAQRISQRQMVALSSVRVNPVNLDDVAATNSTDARERFNPTPKDTSEENDPDDPWTMGTQLLSSDFM